MDAYVITIGEIGGMQENLSDYTWKVHHAEWNLERVVE